MRADRQTYSSQYFATRQVVAASCIERVSQKRSRVVLVVTSAKGDAEIAGVENAEAEIARVDNVWQAKVLTCISDYTD